MSISVNTTFSSPELSLLNDVELAQSGDQQAFSRLINHTRNLVSSIALSIVKDLDNSEDVAQQVYIGAWQSISELKQGNSFLPWLRQMTRYKALNFLRDNKTGQKINGEEADLILAEFCDPKSDMDHAMHREQSNVILQDFISQLPEESRELVLLYYREEQSSKQVAHLLEQSESNVRKKLSRVRQLLHQQILSKHGKMILSTAPTMGLSSLVLGAITSSTPVAAATLSSAATTGKSGLLSKFTAVLGGSMIGAFFAVLAVHFSTSLLLKKLSNEEAKKQVKNYRKNMTLWIIFGAILLTCGYELTVGWWGPVSAYTVFALGLFLQMRTVHKLVERELYNHPCASDKALRSQRIQRLCGSLGLVGGILTGFAGLIIGLVSSGRL